MKDAVKKFVQSKTIALYGASPGGKKFGNAVYKTLRKNDYNLIPVHPTADTIEGDKAYSNPESLPVKPEAAFICMKPDKAETVIDQLAEGGIKRIWFQQGADFANAIKKAEAAGIETVSGKCILMYAEPVTGLHAFHRWLWKLLGKY